MSNHTANLNYLKEKHKQRLIKQLGFPKDSAVSYDERLTPKKIRLIATELDALNSKRPIPPQTRIINESVGDIVLDALGLMVITAAVTITALMLLGY